MKTIVHRKYVNQYRTIKVQFESFPEHIRPKDFNFYAYLNGERANKVKGMTLFDFDTIIFLQESKNTKNEIEYVHCLAHRDGSTFLTPIILKRK